MEDVLMYGTPCPIHSPLCEDVDNGTFLSNSSFPIGNGTAEQEVITSWSSMVLMCATSILLALIILSTIVGNVLVIVAVFTQRNLQNVANRLIVSLAVADMMVACFVMGPAAHYMISGSWRFLGAIGCDLWTSADVLSCSASILHLLAVALDRFWAVSRINWTVNRNKNHINAMIAMIWLVAFMVSVAPLLGWKDPDFWERIGGGRCTVSPSVSYQIFATLATFYVPTILILILYWKIWQTAKNRIRRHGKGNNNKLPTSTSTNPMPATKIPMSSTFSGDELSCHTATVETSSESVVGSPMTPMVGVVQEMEQMQNPTIYCDEESGINPSVGPSENQLSLKPPNSPFRTSQGSLSSPDNEPHATTPVPSNSNHKIKDLKTRKETLEAKRERKAAKTLAVITGAFMACWLPFFVMVVVLAFCKECDLPEYLINLIQWLGYINSTLNPIIYTVFNPEFRLAFKRILFGTKASRRRRH